MMCVPSHSYIVSSVSLSIVWIYMCSVSHLSLARTGIYSQQVARCGYPATSVRDGVVNGGRLSSRIGDRLICGLFRRESVSDLLVLSFVNGYSFTSRALFL